MATPSGDHAVLSRTSYLDSIDARVPQTPGTELTNRLMDMHGPTECVFDSTNRLVPFPRMINGSGPVDILDLSVKVTALSSGAASITSRATTSASVDVTVRYATRESLDVICDGYEQHLRDSAVLCGPFVQPLSDGRMALDCRLEERGGTHFAVAVEPRSGYRRVRLHAGYECPKPLELLNRFACWHRGIAPVSESAAPVGLEIATFSQGRRAKTIGLYTTTYALPEMTSAALRRSVEERFATEGIRYREPTPGMMFLQNAPFEAEVHLYENEAGVPHLAFAGEFQIR